MESMFFWAGVRFVWVGLPLGVSLLAARRALQSRSRNAIIYIAFSGYAAVSGLTMLPYAMYLERATAPALLLAASSLVFWGALNRYLRRPILGYRARLDDRSTKGLSAAAHARKNLRSGDALPDLNFIPNPAAERLN